MTTKKHTVDFILHQFYALGNALARKMFGDYGLWCDSKLVVLICRDQPFVKRTTLGRSVIDDPVDARHQERVE